MTHRLTLSPRRAAVLRWAEREVSSDLVAVWSPEDKQTLAGMVADGLVMPTGARYLLTPDGAKALLSDPASYFPPITRLYLTTDVAADFPPSDPDL